MKAGDLCRCITNFSGVLPEELTLYRNDIVQVHMVVDRHWLEVEGGGSVGRVPSSVLVKVDLPPHPSHLPLFVASAEFMPSQPGDLGFVRGDFVIGLNPIDEAWWCGEINGKKGIFPLNFVWSINKDIIQLEDKGEKQVRLRGRVKTSLRAQLPEELDLYAGDIVNITHVVDSDWYRGESNGATGIFPSNFVDIVEETSVPSTSALCTDRNSHVDSRNAAVTSSQAVDSGLCSNFVVQDTTHTVASPPVSSFEAFVPSVGHAAPATDYSTCSANIAPMASTSHSVGQISACPATLSKTSSHWKTVDNSDDADIFDDDYFKQNMPGFFSSSLGSGNTSKTKDNDTCLISSTPSPTNYSPSSSKASSRYENIPEASLFPEKTCHDALTAADTMGVPQLSSKEFGNARDVKGRSEYISENNAINSNTGSDLTITDDKDVTECASESSAFSNVQEVSCDNVLNSLSQKVDKYFSESHFEEKNNVIYRDTKYTIKGVSSVGYNEDNTGIEPYGRALFSFRAQYSNELTFKKGDIIHLLKHVDSHWTLGRVGSAQGIFPTSYVDIIVNCLHNEEELFLSRSDVSTAYLGHAKAAYDFQALEDGDMTMVKGDILKIIKYVDDNWVTVENKNGSKGMCPKSYLSVLDEEVPGNIKEVTNSLSDLDSGANNERESRLPDQASIHDRSRSSSPFSTPGNRRSYNKDDFGCIKKQEVESVLAKNVASLDVTLRYGQGLSDKKGCGSVFTKREECPAEEDKHTVARKVPLEPVSTPVIPTRIKRTSTVDSVRSVITDSEDSKRLGVKDTQSYTDITSSVANSIANKKPTPTTRTILGTTKDFKSPFVSPRTVTVPVPQTRKEIENDSQKSVTSSTITEITPSFDTTTVATNVSGPVIMPNNKEMDADTTVAKPSQPSQQQPSEPSMRSDADKPLYAEVQKTRLKSKPSLNKFNHQSVEKNTYTEVEVTRCDSAAFPEDVSHVSGDSERTNSVAEAEASNGNSSPALVPQRPAPPPPPKVCDVHYDEVEEYYSLPAEDLEVTNMQNAALSKENKRAKSVRSASETGSIHESSSAQNEEVVREEDKVMMKRNQRRELVQEIVTTEHEYIHDLEALIQVIQQAPSQKESKSVDLITLMGNIDQVIEVAKKFLKLLDRVAYETDEELQVGWIFLLCADELCEIYKIYCSNHNVAAEPLLKKYIEEPEPAAFLHWVLSELQQHKIQLMDMRSVLIKPVQRVLKYPLFLDRLVSETPQSHPDFKDLAEAKTKMANVAKEINEYTKRLDLVNKYRFESDQSLQSRMQRVSLHSVAKKSARISTLVSEMLGFMCQTKDPEFDEEVAKFRSMQKAAAALAQNVDAIVQGIKARHKAELEMARGVVAILHQAGRTPEIEAMQKAASDSCNKSIKAFDNFMIQRIIHPTKQLLSMCEVPERLIQKRHDKMLDYDNAQYKLDKTRDPTRTRILEEELSMAKGTYEGLNTQLMMELPVLTRCGAEIVILSSKSLVAARMYLQGHLAQLYLHLAQIPGLSFSGEDMLAQFRGKYLQQMGEFRQLSFIPVDSIQKSLPRAKGRGHKSLDNTTVKKDASESVKKKVLNSYPAEVIYIVTEVHTPGEVMELTLYPGDHVALLKNKDPLGRSDRWFIDDGDNKGFARAASLRPLHCRENRAEPIATVPLSTSNTVAPSSVRTSNTVVPSSVPVPVAAPRPSTLPRAAPAPPLPERPPRYEDLFPASTSCDPGFPSQTTNYPPAEQPPPRYSPGQVSQVSMNQAPLPSKFSHAEQPPANADHSEVAESEYYSPPLDRQQSNEYNSPVTEGDNIYEEIDQGLVNMEGDHEVEGAESSPIYEVIKDGQLLQDPGQYLTRQPEPVVASEEPQFYYAMYNFGGSDATQLNLAAGQVVLVLHDSSSEWWFVEDRHGHQGYVPASYLTKYS